MLFGYYKKEDLRIEISVKNSRTRETVNLDALGIQSLVPMHDYDSHTDFNIAV